MSGPTKQLTKSLMLSFLLAAGSVGWAQGAPVAPSRGIAPSMVRRLQAAGPQVAAAMDPQEIAAREAIAGHDLLLTMSARINETNSRLQASEDRLTNQIGRTTWLVLGGLTLMFLFASFAGFAVFQYARHIATRKERELLKEGMEPLSVLIHSTRDHVTRLAQRLRMAGATETRLYEGLIGALPPLQVEAGKATFNLSRQIPKSEHPYLQGPSAPLDRVERPARQNAKVVATIGKPGLSAADVGVSSIGKSASRVAGVH